MDYYKKSMKLLAAFNMATAVFRTGMLIMESRSMDYHELLRAGTRILLIFLMGILLIVVIRGMIGMAEATALSALILGVYLWLAFSGFTLNYDTVANVGVVNLLYSTLCIYQGYREEASVKQIRTRKPVMLDIRIKDPGELFRPLVVGPHLEFSQDITGAVDYYIASQVRPAPLILNIYSGTGISAQMRGTAEEAFREHYEDEIRRIRRNLEKHTERSLILFCISMVVMFVWIRFNSIVGDSPVWTILGSMGGFFLWEIGNTHFRHTDEFERLEQAFIAGEARITIL